MAIKDWKYEREDAFDIPDGMYRCRIEDAEITVSSKGNDMVKITLEVSGKKANLWNYITFMPNNIEMTNRMLTQFFDSFGIEEGNFNCADWIGKVGACTVKHDEGDLSKVGYFLNRKKQDALPKWVEPSEKTPRAKKSETPEGFEPADDDIPF